MKRLCLSAFLIILSISCSANTITPCEIGFLKAGGGYHIQIRGQEISNQYIDALFANYPKTKRKGYEWKFKNATVNGAAENLTFKVHQGIAGSTEKGSYYFRTFTSEKYKTHLLANKKETEQHSIIIYLRKGRKSIINTKEKAQLVKDYLAKLIQ